MQHLRAEVSQLRGFGKGADLDAMPAGKNRRIGGEHAVDVGPDLDLFGADARADNGRRVIRPSAAQRRRHAVDCGADEALPSPAHASAPVAGSSPSASRWSRRTTARPAYAGRSVTITSRASTCAALIPALLEMRRHDQAGQALSKSGNRVGRARSQFAHHRQPLHQIRELFEMRVELRIDAAAGRLAQMKLRASRSAVPAPAEALPRPPWLPIASSLLVVLPIAETTTTGRCAETIAHDARDAPDRLRRFDGGSAELHHDHRSRYPSAFMTSAFSTAAPAAPRTVLCPSATNL